VSEKVSADPDDDPAAGLEIGQSIDVFGSLCGIEPVMRAVEFDADLPFLPPHVNPSYDPAPVGQHADLGLRPWRAAGDKR
jgi:hypothetical protein